MLEDLSQSDTCPENYLFQGNFFPSSMTAKQAKATAGTDGTHYLEFGQGKTTTNAAFKKVGGVSVAGGGDNLVTAAPSPVESAVVVQSTAKKFGLGQSVAPANKKTLVPPPVPPPKVAQTAAAGGFNKKKIGAALDNYMPLEQKPAEKLEPLNRFKVTRAQPTKRPKSECK
uniref:Uncharacterized protein n=1 Tax=Romanomermis culicivorax TaxID=13658 RepID=A0A915KEH4_ROMCU